jgi:hypothetical protein
LETKLANARKSGTGSMPAHDQVLREQLTNLLKGGGAHVSLADAIKGFPERKRGTYATGLPHTGWQLLEHLRIAQWDILEFSRNPKHVSPEFPDGYWPPVPAPRSDADWNKTFRAFQRGSTDMIKLINNSHRDLFAELPRGNGQTLLQEALVLADHNAYHTAQIVDLRRAFGSWPGG